MAGSTVRNVLLIHQRAGGALLAATGERLVLVALVSRLAAHLTDILAGCVEIRASAAVPLSLALALVLLLPVLTHTRDIDVPQRVLDPRYLIRGSMCARHRQGLTVVPFVPWIVRVHRDTGVATTVVTPARV